MPEENDRLSTLKAKVSALMRTNSLLGNIVDLIRETIYVTDQDGTIILYNKESERMEGLKKEDVVGRKEEDVYPLTNGHSFNEEIVGKIFMNAKPIRNQYYRYMLPSGKMTNFIFSSYPFIENGKVTAVITVGRNMTQISDFIATTFELQQQILLEDNSLVQGKTSFDLDDIITENPTLKKSILTAKKVAMNQSPVLICGETGTGKELIAQGIHNASLCRSAPFLPINCGAIPETLLESALFGTVKGAFTGAVDMPGLFEQAGNGTIFLDEINSMPSQLQPKLLRVLQDKMVRRVGSKFETEVKCRIVSASNLDPYDAMQQGILRPDLLFRLSTFIITLPPLRERGNDVALLLQNFIQRFNIRYNKDVQGFSEFFLNFLAHYDWPGNVRELENLIENIICLVEPEEKILTIHHIPDYSRDRMEKRVALSHNEVSKEIPAITSYATPFDYGDIRNQVDDTERRQIEEALLQNKCNLTKAGENLGISRQTLIYRMKKYGLWKKE